VCVEEFMVGILHYRELVVLPLQRSPSLRLTIDFDGATQQSLLQRQINVKTSM
jgi:hypothetical protein